MKFKFTRNGNGWFWMITYADGTVEDYKTDKRGEGLWIWDKNRQEYRQISGTCQFQARQETDGGQKAYIRRWFR